jgi:hypothetical protein
MAASAPPPTTAELITLAAKAAGNLYQTMCREGPPSHTANAVPNGMSILQAALGAANLQTLNNFHSSSMQAPFPNSREARKGANDARRGSLDIINKLAALERLFAAGGGGGGGSASGPAAGGRRDINFLKFP